MGDYLIAFLVGGVSAAGAVLPPGMLNLSVATCSLESGRRAGIWYAGGIVTVFLAQTAIAIIGANYLRDNPDIVEILSWWAIPVLVFLAAYFILKWYREDPDNPTDSDGQKMAGDQHPYRHGIMVSLMNFLAIPYYFAVGTWLMNDGVLSTAVIAKGLFVLGAAAGAMLILTGYARGARWVDAHAHYVTRNVHLLVGMLFIILAGIQGYRMLVVEN